MKEKILDGLALGLFVVMVVIVLPGIWDELTGGPLW